MPPEPPRSFNHPLHRPRVAQPWVDTAPRWCTGTCANVWPQRNSQESGTDIAHIEVKAVTSSLCSIQVNVVEDVRACADGPVNACLSICRCLCTSVHLTQFHAPNSVCLYPTLVLDMFSMMSLRSFGVSCCLLSCRDAGRVPTGRFSDINLVDM